MLEDFLESPRLNEHLRFFAICAMANSNLSTCDRHHIGASIFDFNTKSLLSTGRNGVEPGKQHCEDLISSGELLYKDHQAWSKENETHAEINAIRFLPESAVGSDSLGILVTHTPCPECAEAIINAGIKLVVFLKDWTNGGEDVEKKLLLNQVTIVKSSFSYDDIAYNPVKRSEPKRYEPRCCQ